MKKLLIFLLLLSNLAFSQQATVGIVGTKGDTTKPQFVPPNGLYRLYIKEAGDELWYIKPNKSSVKLLGNKVTTWFYRDRTFPADTGKYSISIIDNQPYLNNKWKDTLKFKMEYPYIRAWSTGKDLAVNLTGKPPSVICLRDSVTFTLPSASDTLNKYVKYNIMYLGARGGTGANKWLPFNSDYLITFSDTIRFVNPADNIVYFSKTFSSSTTAKSWFRIKPNQRIVLEILNKKWYLSLQNFDY